MNIKIAMVDVKVTMDHHNLNEREIKIIEVLFLNLSAQTNAFITQSGMALNPLEKIEKEDIFHYQFAWQSSILPEQYEEIKKGINERITYAVEMCELPEIKITFKENSYLNR